MIAIARRACDAAWGFSLRQFWGGHPNTFRSFFAWASLSYGVFMVLHPQAFEGRPYSLMHLCAPLWVWAALFILHWCLVSHILLRGAHRGWQFIVNFLGFSIWAAYVTLQDFSLGYFALNSSMERIAVIYSVWAMLRSGMGRRTEGL